MVFSDDEKGSLSQNLEIKEIILRIDPFYIGHGNLQPSGAKQWDKYCHRYHINMILEHGQLKDDIAFAYGNTLSKAAKDDKDKQEHKKA